MNQWFQDAIRATLGAESVAPDPVDVVLDPKHRLNQIKHMDHQISLGGDLLYTYVNIYIYIHISILD